MIAATVGTPDIPTMVDLITQIVYEAGKAVTYAEIHAHPSVGHLFPATVNRGLADAVDAGLLVTVDYGVCEITDAGRSRCEAGTAVTL
jgi:hypothetical protein